MKNASAKNIYLVGFMATGKSSVGRELADRRNLRFVDLDKIIESKEKKPIPDIFAQQGEVYFRKIETEALVEISQKDGLVVSCGGGIVINRDNIRVMKETGVVVCLTAEPGVILKRSSSANNRPLLNVADPRKQIELLLEKRASCYALADKTIDTSKLSIKQVAEEVLKLVFPRE